MKDKYKWMPCAMRGTPDKDSEHVVIEKVGSNQNGDEMFVIETPSGMTAAELRNFAIFLVETFK